ncbi:hypothetical protein [Flammeovirga agarivorans]|uniref:Uncharacterized protein n=1 Tax=Flammeovirga agarivorans TaxID=2726742 RepID=A0A7X8XU40_9BACT|nr:hypothetical protein [Flammeovirga agarivorans]NLR89973.1 hypothetical protein [Flammeovirga agarivorans]
MKKLLTISSIYLIGFLFSFSFSFAESYNNVKPLLERYSSIDDWENPNNWSPKVVPNKESFISVKEKFFIIDFNTRSHHISVKNVDVPAGSEFTITSKGSLFITEELFVNPKSAIIVEGKLTVQKAMIHCSSGEFTLERIGTIDAHELFIKIDNYDAEINGHISTTYLDLHFYSKDGTLRIGDEADIRVQSETIVKNKYKDNVVGDISNIVTYSCDGTDKFCKWVTPYRLSLPTIVDFFDIEIKDNTAFLYWETANEKNSSHFILEKSNDGENYRELGQIKASVDTKEVTPYDFQDSSFNDSKDTYYRLRVVQNDNEEFVWVRHLLAEHGDKEEYGIAKVDPNPTNYKLTINMEMDQTDDLDIKLHHTENESVWDIKPNIEESNAIFDVHHYPAGPYILKVKQKEKLIYSGNVIIYATKSRGDIRNSQVNVVEEE